MNCKIVCNALILFILTFCVLGLPYKKMEFCAEDYVGLFPKKQETFVDYFKFENNGYSQSTKEFESGKETYFFTSTQHVWHFLRFFRLLQNRIFKGFSNMAYWYFLSNIFFHALCFYILFVQFYNAGMGGFSLCSALCVFSSLGGMHYPFVVDFVRNAT